MLFRVIAAFVSVALIPQGALAALTPADVVTNVGIVTKVSGNINSALSPITLTSSPDVITTAAQTVVSGLQTIITNLGNDVTAMDATPPFADGVTQPIVDSLTAFVEVHQALLSTIIGKKGIFANYAAAQPITAALRSLEAGIDSFAYAMIDLIPTRQTDVTGDKNQLDSSVQNTITEYEALCIPLFILGAILDLPAICIDP